MAIVESFEPHGEVHHMEESDMLQQNLDAVELKLSDDGISSEESLALETQKAEILAKLAEIGIAKEIN